MYIHAHVEEDRLEDYARQDCAGSVEFEDVQRHLGSCTACRERLADLNEFVAFLRRSTEASGQIRYRHNTSRGTLFLVVTGSDGREWEGRVLGPGLNILQRFCRGAYAKAHVESVFDAEFPGHRCGNGCGPGWV